MLIWWQLQQWNNDVCSTAKYNEKPQYIIHNIVQRSLNLSYSPNDLSLMSVLEGNLDVSKKGKADAKRRGRKGAGGRKKPGWGKFSPIGDWLISIVPHVSVSVYIYLYISFYISQIGDWLISIVPHPYVSVFLSISLSIFPKLEIDWYL